MLDNLPSLFDLLSVNYQWLNQKLCVRQFTDFILVHSVMDQWLQQKYCVSHSLNLVWGAFGNWPVIKVDTMWYLFYQVDFGFIWQLTSKYIRSYVLDNLLSCFGVHSVIDQWLKQTLCVSYFNEFILGYFGTCSVNNARTVFYIFYWVD